VSELDRQIGSLYPDLVRAGSLSASLDEALARVGSALRSTPNYHGRRSGSIASVSTRQRSAQVFSALDERRFGLSLFELFGTEVEAGGWDAELTQVASAIALVLDSDRKFFDLVREIPFLEEIPFSDLDPFPQGGERLAYIEEVWLELLTARVVHRHDELFHFDELPELIRQASERPELRRLLPYTSLWRFSVAMRLHPRDMHIPIIWPLGSGQYSLSYDSTGECLAEGSASVVLDALVDHLPGSRR
jgi:hypothetical protein